MNTVLGLNQLEEVINEVYQYIEIQIIERNRKGELDGFLTQIGYYGHLFSESKSDKTKILVIGQSNTRKRDLINIIKMFGYEEENFEFIINYEDVLKFDFEGLINSDKYEKVLVGPMNHKQKGIKGYSSAIVFLESEKNCPETRRIVNSNNSLEITKSSFKRILESL